MDGDERWTLRRDGTYEGPSVEGLHVVSALDRNRWRREYETEKAKVRRLEHWLQSAAEDERARIIAWLRTEPSDYIGPEFCGRIADLLASEKAARVVGTSPER